MALQHHLRQINSYFPGSTTWYDSDLRTAVKDARRKDRDGNIAAIFAQQGRLEPLRRLLAEF
jgi:hypothetical protein